MSEIIPPDEFNRLRGLDSDALRQEFAEALSLTAAQLLRLAAIVRVLEERGEDLTELKTGMLGYLRRIAYGQILPEVVVRFSEYPSLVQRVANLPLSDQRRLASGDPVPLLVYRDGQPDHRMVDPLSLTGPEVIQVFAKDHIRDDSEQVLIVERRKAKQPRKRAKIRSHDKDGIVVGRTHVTLQEIMSALRQDTPAEDADRSETVVAKLTADEHRALKINAAKQNCSMSELVHRALESLSLLRSKE